MQAIQIVSPYEVSDNYQESPSLHSDYPDQVLEGLEICTLFWIPQFEFNLQMPYL